MDVHTPAQRSKNMAAIRGGGNISTERLLIDNLKKSKIRGFSLKTKTIFGRPDVIFRSKKLAVFTDGCFWHGCKKCFTEPRTNKQFWKNKISGNKKRDKLVNRKLRNDGWTVIRIWEHDLRDTQKVIKKIRQLL